MASFDCARGVEAGGDFEPARQMTRAALLGDNVESQAEHNSVGDSVERLPPQRSRCTAESICNGMVHGGPKGSTIRAQQIYSWGGGDGQQTGSDK